MAEQESTPRIVALWVRFVIAIAVMVVITGAIQIWAGDWLDATFGFDCNCIVSKLPGIEFCTGRCYQLGPVSLSSTAGAGVATVLTFVAGLLAGWLAPAAAERIVEARH